MNIFKILFSLKTDESTQKENKNVNKWFLNEVDNDSVRLTKNIYRNFNDEVRYKDLYGKGTCNISIFSFLINRNDIEINRTYINDYTTDVLDKKSETPSYKVIIDINKNIWSEHIYTDTSYNNNKKYDVSIEKICLDIYKDKIEEPFLKLDNLSLTRINGIDFNSHGELKVAFIRLSDDKVIHNKIWKF